MNQTHKQNKARKREEQKRSKAIKQLNQHIQPTSRSLSSGGQSTTPHS